MSGIIKTSSAAMLLEQWGIWAWSAPDRLGYTSPMMQIMHDNVERKERRYILVITDDVAMEVDAGVCALHRLQPGVAKVVRLYCLYRKNMIEIAEIMGCSRKLVANMYDQGVMWMDGYLSNSEKYAIAS
jgi:hypothetical protein